MAEYTPLQWMQRCVSIQSTVGQETQPLATVQHFKQENLYQVFWPFITLIVLIPFFFLPRKYKDAYTNLLKKLCSVQQIEGSVGFSYFLIQTDLASSLPHFLLGFGATAVKQDLEGLLYLHQKKDE